MGQILDKHSTHMMYDANGWRRLSLQYLNSLLGENGEPIDGGGQLNADGTPRRGGSRPSTPNGSRRSSFGSRGDIQNSFRLHNLQDERPVLQEYEPTWKNGKPSPNRTGGTSGVGSPGRETDFPPIGDSAIANRPGGPNDGRASQQQHEKPLTNGNGANGQSYNNNNNKTNYADIISPNRAALPNVKITSSQNSSSTKKTHFAPNRGDTFDHEYQDQRNGSAGPHQNVLNVINGSHHLGGEQPDRTHSPKSTSTWASTTDDYQSSSINSNDPNYRGGQYDSHNYLSRYGQHQESNRGGNGAGGGGRLDINSYQQNGTSKYYQQGGDIGQQHSFSSRQSSGRGSGRSGGGGAGGPPSDHYIPYRDYFLDRKLRGETGPNSYSDFSGYSRNSRQRARQQISITKWVFILAALIHVASTIWNSVYMQMMSKRMELGYTIQGRLYSMTDMNRHLWEGIIIAAQVVSNLVNILAIYAALVERYWIIWCYTWLMFLYGMFGAVSELTRGSYSSWILPLVCGLLAIILTHQLAINRICRGYMSK